VLLALAAVALLALPASASAAPGDLYSYGYNLFAQVSQPPVSQPPGQGISTPSQVPLPPGSGPVTAVAGGTGQSLVLTSSGQLYAFGENQFGQLGNTTNNNPGGELPFTNSNPTPVPVTLPGAKGQPTEIAAGLYDSFVVTSGGQLYSFGQNDLGELGRTTNVGNENPNPTPTQVVLPGATGSVAKVASGIAFALVLTTGGQLYSFGYNFDGELGRSTNNGVSTGNPTPAVVSLPGASGLPVAISAGEFHSLVLTSTGQLYSFGYNFEGQLGRAANAGTSNHNPTPALVTLPPEASPVAEVSGGRFHSLVRTETGQVYAFGSNEFGQLGNTTNIGTEKPNSTPVPVVLPVGAGTPVHVTASGDFSMILTSTGRIYAFGENKEGQLGNTTNFATVNPNSTPTPVAMPGGETIEFINTGSSAFHVLAVVADLSVATGALPAGAVEENYDATAAAAGGRGSYSWSASGLPPGLTIDEGGRISGTPTATGHFTPTLSVSDGYGIVASRTLTLEIPGAGQAPPPNRPPEVSRLKPSATTFSLAGRRVGGKCVDETAANGDDPACRQQLKLPLTFTLDSPAKVTIALDRLSSGRLVHGHCAKPSDGNGKRPPCTRATEVGNPLTKRADAGVNRLTLIEPALPPGRYRLSVTPASSGKGSAAQTTIQVK
jgi:alpha-tubulin suppressor-like RCC1 family protein